MIGNTRVRLVVVTFDLAFWAGLAVGFVLGCAAAASASLVMR